jgi:hypothetical protein
MNTCPTYPCRQTAAGCPVCNPKPQYTLPQLPTYTPVPPGCICPPTSEQTCRNPTCPRQDHSKDKAAVPQQPGHGSIKGIAGGGSTLAEPPAVLAKPFACMLHDGKCRWPSNCAAAEQCLCDE